jgi:hypothetical protein
MFWQVPKAQTCIAPHLLPQPPQLFGSCCVRTQVPLQLVVPMEHWQPPFTQLPKPPHVVPHVPQFELSLCGLMHKPLQRMKPIGQAIWQMLLAQV